MGRRPCCDKVGLKRGPWTVEEDHKLVNFILNNGIHCWRTVPKLADLLRCGKSCRLRWINYLRPDLKRGDFTEAEEDLLIELHACLGNKWSKIASHFPGRTDNEIKNHWNTRTKKRLKRLGLDPLTHKPIPEELNLGSNEEPGCPNLAGSELTSDQTNELFNNNVCSSSSYSSSFSVEESGAMNDQTHDSLQLQQWVESVDSILSWDLFDRLDEDMFFLGKTQ